MPGSTVVIALVPAPFVGPRSIGIDLYLNQALYRTVYAADIPLAMQRFMAKRADSHTTEIDSSHAAIASPPDTVSDLIRHAADAIAP